MAHILGSIWRPRFKYYLLGWSGAFIGCQIVGSIWGPQTKYYFLGWSGAVISSQITLYYERKRFQQTWTEVSKRQDDIEALQTERHAATIRRLTAERYSANIRELEELAKQRDRLWTWMWAVSRRRTQND
ncbi:hypothetical protein EDD37DRAFT_652269 [Exophiala viscosa]|uniref:uncharacterized protein n=1 Tax=Exophiala viscosa TaxID=2486360 RepID=UPI002198764A|nr:hypothetical protein EDD37DRAFT_652269 [Exophiala viscosa]